MLDMADINILLVCFTSWQMKLEILQIQTLITSPDLVNSVFCSPLPILEFWNVGEDKAADDWDNENCRHFIYLYWFSIQKKKIRKEGWRKAQNHITIFIKNTHLLNKLNMTTWNDDVKSSHFIVSLIIEKQKMNIFHNSKILPIWIYKPLLQAFCFWINAAQA